MGIADDLAKRYLDHPVYTPRQDLLLVDSLHRLGTATGRDAYLNAAMVATDEVEANFFRQHGPDPPRVPREAEPDHGHHDGRAADGGADQGRGGDDPVRAGPRSVDGERRQAQPGLKTSYRAPGFNGSFELWVSGTVSATGSGSSRPGASRSSSRSAGASTSSTEGASARRGGGFAIGRRAG